MNIDKMVGNMFTTRKSKIITAAVVISAVSMFILFRNGSGSDYSSPRIGPVVDAVYALGTVKSDRWYNLRFGMNTVIQKIFVKEGNDVASGDPLLATDTSLMFRAPFAGKVTLVAFKPSEMAPAGQNIITISDMRDMYVRVSLDQESILSVRKGQDAVVSFENLRGVKTNGRVENVYPSGSEFIVRISVEKFPEGVLPEMTCDAAITVRKKDNALMIPQRAVAGGKVTLIRNGKKISVQVQAKPVDEDWTEVTDDSVKADDKIFVPGKTGKSNNKAK